jgi:hypothetical protein
VKRRHREASVLSPRVPPWVGPRPHWWWLGAATTPHPSNTNLTAGTVNLSYPSALFTLIMKLPWTRLIRFEATDGRILRGEPVLPNDDFDLGGVTEADQLKAKIITGDDIFDTTGKTKVTDETATVKTILGPLTREDVPVLRCIGLNYAKHSMSLTIERGR